jgi:uncharacterized protein YciI
MTHYVVGLLRRAVAPPHRTEREAEALQEAHLAHLRRLREVGELLTVGPVEEDGELRGILVFRTDQIPRAREMMATDPLVEGGYLILDLYTWFSPAGLALSHDSVGATNVGIEGCGRARGGRQAAGDR